MATKIRNQKMAISRSKKFFEIFFFDFRVQNSKLHDICSTSKIVHPPFNTYNFSVVQVNKIYGINYKVKVWKHLDSFMI